MMVDGRHLEKTLAVGQLEIAHLQDHGKGLHDIHEAHQNQNQRHLQSKCQAAHNTAQEQRTGIAHEHLGRMPVIGQICQQTAHQACGQKGNVSLSGKECRKAAVLGKPIFVICDNVYNQLTYGVSCPDLSIDPELKDQLILCQSFSKPYAMTGWRVGYLTCPDYVMDRLLLLSAGNITAVPTFVQEAAVIALQTDPTPMRDTYAKRREYVCRRLREMDLSFPEPEGAFYVFPSIAKFGIPSADFCTRMIKEGRVAAVPGSCFGAEGYIRLSYCYSDAELKKGLDRMEAFIRTLEQ